MRRIMLIFLLLSGVEKYAAAQGLPAFICDTSKASVDTVKSWWKPLDLAENLCQSIYYKSDFPTMPSQGFITDVFFKIGYVTPAGSTLPGLTVKLGITNLNDYPMMHFTKQQFLSMDSTLTTVFYDSNYVLPVALPANSWWKLPLPQPFQYSMLPLPGDVPQNLVVQLSKSVWSNTLTWKFHPYYVAFTGASNRHGSIWASINNPPGDINPTPPFDAVLLIGFNGYALSVDDPQKKIPFSVFPNPATDKLQLGKEVGGTYEVYNMAGVKVAAGRVVAGAQVDVQHLPPGMYLLKLGAQSARFLKR